eukprot:gnl/Trimastix_PCT/1442.p1 GENE.gnl/Trimastix_PCT/1442~~gnl/Trimastix_PCT/1442.p1  ORF type:complete len:662 (-),score=195.99 gnl/Trimastix_PCT/1442:20-1750(-)
MEDEELTCDADALFLLRMMTLLIEEKKGTVIPSFTVRSPPPSVSLTMQALNLVSHVHRFEEDQLVERRATVERCLKHIPNEELALLLPDANTTRAASGEGAPGTAEQANFISVQRISPHESLSGTAAQMQASASAEETAEGGEEPLHGPDQGEARAQYAGSRPWTRNGLEALIRRYIVPLGIRLMCVADCNAFTMLPDIGFALNYYGSFFNHGCRPNCAACHDSMGRLCIRAVRPISAGDELSVNYVDLFQSRSRRHSILFESYYFRCMCPRCQHTRSREFSSLQDAQALVTRAREEHERSPDSPYPLEKLDLDDILSAVRCKACGAWMLQRKLPKGPDRDSAECSRFWFCSRDVTHAPLQDRPAEDFTAMLDEAWDLCYHTEETAFDSTGTPPTPNEVVHWLHQIFEWIRRLRAVLHPFHEVLLYCLRVSLNLLKLLHSQMVPSEPYRTTERFLTQYPNALHYFKPATLEAIAEYMNRACETLAPATEPQRFLDTKCAGAVLYYASVYAGHKGLAAVQHFVAASGETPVAPGEYKRQALECLELVREHGSVCFGADHFEVAEVNEMIQALKAPQN